MAFSGETAHRTTGVKRDDTPNEKLFSRDDAGAARPFNEYVVLDRLLPSAEGVQMNIARGVLLAALAACVSLQALADDSPAKVNLEFRRAETKAADGLTEATVAGSAVKVYLHKEADLTNDDVAQATVDSDKENGVLVKLTFTKEGAKKAAKLSEEHKDKPVAIVIDGKVVSAPVIRSKFGEKVQITGHFTKAEAERIVKTIQPRSP